MTAADEKAARSKVWEAINAPTPLGVVDALDAYRLACRAAALGDAAEKLAKALPAPAVTQADWMGGRHDQHAADVAYLRSLADTEGSAG